MADRENTKQNRKFRRLLPGLALAFAVWRAGEMAIAFFQGGAQGGGAA